MKLVGYIQLKNELQAGHLHNCLKSLSLVTDEFVIYDDGSTDGSQEVYKQYTPHVIQGPGGQFGHESMMSQRLLEYCKFELKGDWAIWLDGDAVFSRGAERATRKLMEQGERDGWDAWSVHWINLFLSPRWYRVDDRFDDLVTVGLFKLKPELYYDTTPGLHRKRYPEGIDRWADQREFEAIHFGFASVEAIEQKYRQYKQHGQQGWELERFIPNKETMSLSYLGDAFYPDFCLPPAEGEPPTCSDLSYLRSE